MVSYSVTYTPSTLFLDMYMWKKTPNTPLLLSQKLCVYNFFYTKTSAKKP